MGGAAAPPLLFRSLPLLRLRLLHQLIDRPITRRHVCSAASESSDLLPLKSSPSIGGQNSLLISKTHRYYDVDGRRWKEKEAEILEDIEPTICFTKQILHSDRYMDGECLTPDDEKTVVDKLLVHHPHSEDKIGCGLDSIMVDRHPQFKHSRCLFVVRTDGGWIDFSYQKCLRAYIRQKYPSDADKFIREHFKRGSG